MTERHGLPVALLHERASENVVWCKTSIERGLGRALLLFTTEEDQNHSEKDSRIIAYRGLNQAAFLQKMQQLVYGTL